MTQRQDIQEAHATQGIHPRHIAIIVSCCLSSGIPAGMLMNTPGIFYPVIANELGVQTAEISAWMAICLLSAAVFQPLAGNLVSRLPMRVLMLAGAFVMIGVFLVFAAATAPWMFWAAGVFTGIPFATCLSVGPATLVNRWFGKHVGLLLGTAAACSAIGGVVFMMLGQAIIDTLGWRTAYLVYAGIIAAVCVPVLVLGVRDYPADCGLAPWGAESFDSEVAPQEEAATHPSPQAEAEARRQARLCMRTPAFLLLLLSGFLMNFVCQVNGFFPKYVYWVDEQAALGLVPMAFVTGVALSSITQAGSAAGKLILGFFSDFSVRNALTMLCAAGGVGMLFIWMLPSTPLMPLGGFVYGFFLASVLVLVPMLVRDVFGGGERYPILYARVAVAPAFGGAAANVVWPVLADNFGGFDAVFGPALVMLIVLYIAAMAALRLGDGSAERQG